LKIAERNNYLKNVKHSFKPDEVNNEVYYVWELKKPELLVNYCNMSDQNLARRRRIHKQKVLENLWKLIITIDKTTKLEDIEKKINPVYDRYNSIQSETPQPAVKRGKKRILEETNITDLDKTSVEKNLKRLKIESDVEAKPEDNDKMEEEVEDPEPIETPGPTVVKKKRKPKKTSSTSKIDNENEPNDGTSADVNKSAKKPVIKEFRVLINERKI
jgi:hypothetical protein